MKTNVSVYDFERAFVNMDRADNFSYAGKKALYEYLEQYAQDCGTEVELDVIALCCEYTEYVNLTELKEVYPDIETIGELQDNTIVIYIDDPPGQFDDDYDGRFIIQDY